jgi:hypothetical protein
VAMKFWNKQHTVRKRHWTKIVLPRETMLLPDVRFEGWTNYKPFLKIKYDLQLNQSDGKFYMTIMRREIWFERAEDATVFLLTQE